MKKLFLSLTIAGITLLFAACNGDKKEEIVLEKFTDVDATAYDKWVYIDLNAQTATALDISAEAPDSWDFALHRYDCKTNKGAALETGYRSLETLYNEQESVSGNFVEDIWTDSVVIADISGMMQGSVVYAQTYYNEELSKWLRLDMSVMPPVYEMSERVYVLRLQNGKKAGIRFTDYMNVEATKGYISFEYAFLK